MTTRPGFAADGFAPVRETFEEVIAETPEGGAALSIHQHGRPVVDLWGGMAARNSPWREETLLPVWSGTKGLVAACLLKLMEDRHLALDEPVARYWPEFGRNGKQSITVRQAVSHTDGLTGLSAVRIALTDILDSERMENHVAAEPEPDDARSFGCYHPLTFGWICGGLVRRIDGRSVGRFFADEFAGPLGLDLWIGLPAAENHRTGQLSLAPSWEGAAISPPGAADHDPLVWRTWANPDLFPGDLPWNTEPFHAAEIPGAGGIGSARSMSRFYAALVNGGSLDGVRVLKEATIEQGIEEIARFVDPLVGRPLVLGTGFWLQNDEPVFGPPSRAFGHPGAGVSMHGAWPELGVAFSFLPNVMLNDPNDTRAQRILATLHECAKNRRDTGQDT